jgi:hypothetical protein
MTEEFAWPTTLRVLLMAMVAAIFAPLVLQDSAIMGSGTRLLLGLTVFVVAWFIWVFTRLRIVVDAEALTIGFGPFRERIPRALIAECGMTQYRWQEWGGIGLRIRPGARLYNVPGDGGWAVRVRLRDGQIRLFSSRRPSAICNALEN